MTLALGHTVEGFVEKEGGIDVLLKEKIRSMQIWEYWQLVLRRMQTGRRGRNQTGNQRKYCCQ